MAKTYRDIYIQVGLGLFTTQFVGAATDVKTEHNIARLLINFPAEYADYVKMIDIAYTTASDVYTVESYNLSYSGSLQKYFFILDRRFTSDERAYIQFRARFADGQESVDPAILSLRFRRALRETEIDELDCIPTETASVELQDLITAHEGVIASSIHLGHVSIDNDTIVVGLTGTISVGTESRMLDFSIDGEGVVINTGTKITYFVPFDCEISAWNIVSYLSGSIVIDVKKTNYIDFPSSTSISGTEKITLDNDYKNQDSSLSSWETELQVGDILEFYVESAETITKVSIGIEVIK